MKKKGTRAERELLHLFWETKKWGAIRAAGSGSIPLPAPDILAGNGLRYLAIECKSLKKDKKYFHKDELQQLKLFAKRIGAEPWLAIRFDFKDWYFLPLNKVKKSKGNMFFISLVLVEKYGLNFEGLVNAF